MADTNNGQLNLRLKPNFIEKLGRDADRFGFKGKNSVAQDILQTFYPNWLAMQRRLKVVKTQELEKAA